LILVKAWLLGTRRSLLVNN